MIEALLVLAAWLAVCIIATGVWCATSAWCDARAARRQRRGGFIR